MVPFERALVSSYRPSIFFYLQAYAFHRYCRFYAPARHFFPTRPRSCLPKISPCSPGSKIYCLSGGPTLAIELSDSKAGIVILHVGEQLLLPTAEVGAGLDSLLGAVVVTRARVRGSDGLPLLLKGHHSVLLQAVCTSDLKFIDCIYAGEVGSVHDASVFKRSPLYSRMMTDSTLFTGDTHIVGDAMLHNYPLMKNLIVPFRDNGSLSARQRRFCHQPDV